MSASHVMAYLEWAESQETDPDYQDSYRCAWITVRLAPISPSPFVEAHYIVYGIHPDRMPTALTERRLAQLGRWYDHFWGVPKKLPQSIRKGPLEMPEQADSPDFPPTAAKVAVTGAD